ncbi:acetyl-CoA acetyltransferase, mitochondrial [Plakobranchus ocellatus]|uniref:acetyl-CoA C-acetyltransferase n=1 Tax=Plakobranchus ocellatus TaxID=259542 RepID=A0AAV4A4X1_9GAST|nr:acetyl-CoA acetyltransferase, mitochondrial [Plakobranchus ocellatus]
MAQREMQEVVIASAARTPIGAFQGSLSTVSACTLGSVAISAAVKRAGLSPDDVDEVYMGSVLQAGLRQGPCKQAALSAGLPTTVPATTINKLCASGMKAIMMAAQNLMCGHQSVMVAGGMESMSNVPYYIKRGVTPYGGFTAEDGLLFDSLQDPHSGIHMGEFSEHTASRLDISREEQDEFAIRSYQLSQEAASNGVFQKEIAKVPVPQRKGEYIFVSEDEEYKKFNKDKMKTLRTVFKKEGDFVDAATDPINFTIAPALAIRKLLARCGVKAEDVSMWEINEAFSAVVLACLKELNLSTDRVNIHGGAVSIGHPLGMSGARITGHMAHTLEKDQYGVAAICNGGGGASAIIIQGL